jgi:hypothetical protein
MRASPSSRATRFNTSSRAIPFNFSGIKRDGIERQFTLTMSN